MMRSPGCRNFARLLPLRRSRSGQLLAIVLVALVLISLLLYSYHFVAMSEYSQVSRIILNYQTKLIADAANDELAIQQEKAVACSGAKPPDWVDQVIDAIDKRPVGPTAAGAPNGTPPAAPSGTTPPNGSGAPQGVPVTPEIITDNGGELPGTTAVGQGAGVPPGSLTVKVTIGPLYLVPPDYDAKVIYNEPVFQDEKKDIVAWHLRGPFKVETTAESSAGKIVQTQQGTLAVTDATPIANEFALFSYQPPAAENEETAEELAINDLQRGGRFTVHPRQVGRVLVRGPWIVLPADGARVNKPFQADKEEGAENPAPTFQYFERKWKNWAGVPGPRALLPPPLDARGPIKTVLDALHGLWDKIPTIGENEIIRPERENSPELTLGPFNLPSLPFPICIPQLSLTDPLVCLPDKIGPWTFPPISIVVGIGTGGDSVAHAGLWWSILPDDEVGRFGTAMYFHGLVKPEKQLFSILGRTDDPPVDAGGDSKQDFYRGVTFEAEAEEPDYKALNDGGNNPPAELQLPSGAKDNQVILPEPVPRSKDGQTPDVGIMAVYGVGVFDAQTLLDVGVWDLLGELLSKAAGPAGVLVKQVLDFIKSTTGIAPDVYILARQWHIHGYEPPADKLTDMKLDDIVQLAENALPDNFKAGQFDPMGIVAPYGLYFYEHSIHSSERVTQALINMGTSILVNKAVSWLVNNAAVKIAKFAAWLFKKVDGSRAGTYLKDLADLGGTFAADHGILKGLVTVVRGSSDRLFTLLLRVGISKGAINNLLKDLMRDFSKDQIKTQIRDPNFFLPRPVKALLGSFGPEAIDHPFAHRLNGAFTASKDLRDLALKLPHGMFPPKYSSWASLATRIYPDAETWLKAEKVGDVLPLRGIVLLRKLEYKGDPIKYRGVGIVVVLSETAESKPSLDARVEPEEKNASHWMQLVHLVVPELFVKKDRPVLKLGELFTGTVYSETGVAPAGKACVILGNLVCGHINKSAIDKSLTGADEGVTVRYASEILGDLLKPDKKPMWSIEVLGAPFAPPSADLVTRPGTN